MKNKKTLIGLSLIVAMMLILCSCKVQSTDQNDDCYAADEIPQINITQYTGEEMNKISVSGSAKVTLKPDTAYVYIEVRNDADTAEKAQQENSELMAKVLESIKNNGVAEEDIKTSNVNLNERYNYNTSPAKLIGYSMTNTLYVTVKNIENVGKVMSDAIANGASGTHGLSFGVEDTTSAYNEALQGAMEDAFAKARAIAKAAGAQVNAVPVEVNESSVSVPRVYADDVREEAVMKSASDANTPVVVSAGETQVSATVSVVYEMTTAE